MRAERGRDAQVSEELKVPETGDALLQLVHVDKVNRQVELLELLAWLEPLDEDNIVEGEVEVA